MRLPHRRDGNLARPADATAQVVLMAHEQEDAVASRDSLQAAHAAIREAEAEPLATRLEQAVVAAGPKPGLTAAALTDSELQLASTGNGYVYELHDNRVERLGLPPSGRLRLTLPPKAVVLLATSRDIERLPASELAQITRTYPPQEAGARIAERIVAERPVSRGEDGESQPTVVVVSAEASAAAASPWRGVFTMLLMVGVMAGAWFILSQTLAVEPEEVPPAVSSTLTTAVNDGDRPASGSGDINSGDGASNGGNGEGNGGGGNDGENGGVQDDGSTPLPAAVGAVAIAVSEALSESVQPTVEASTPMTATDVPPTAPPTATAADTSTPSPAPTDAPPATSTPSPPPTATAIATATPSITSTPTSSSTSTPPSTSTPTPTSTSTATPPATSTPTSTSTPAATSTPTSTASPTPTSTPTSTDTPAATSTPEAAVEAAQRPADQGFFVAQPLTEERLSSDISEWDGEWTPITSVSLGSENWQGESDVSGEFQALWAPYGLLLVVRVADDTYRDGPNGTQMYLGDGLEIQFDRELDTDFGEPLNSSDDYQIGLSFGPELNEMRAYRWYPYALESSVAVEGAAVPTERGYQAVVLIPWSAFELDGSRLESGQTFGFNVSINDNDGDAPAQQSIISASPARTTYDNPTEWGTLVLN